MTPQLVLPVCLRDPASFDNFYAGTNAELVQCLRDLAGAGTSWRAMYLWGRAGAGKSHLLQALATAADRTCRYVALGEPGLAPTVLDDAAQAALVLIDDIDQVAALPDWQQPLVRLYDMCRERGGVLVVAAKMPPAQAGFVLPDLGSRFTSLLVYRVASLDDAGKLAALKLRAAQRGFSLDDGVGDYILRRVSRDSHALFALLERLDRVTLSEQRRLTVPLLRQVLERN